VKQGDLVKLKSGGPVMTVTSFGTVPTVVCTWFELDMYGNPTGLPKSWRFQADELKVVE
jgi:uncharacterized protein YodC (DUF2158 family)